MQQQETVETRPASKAERAGMITALNQQLIDIKSGRMPGDNREEILARKRALSANKLLSEERLTVFQGPRP